MFDAPKSPYGWEFFAKKIPLLVSKPYELVNTVKVVTSLMIADALNEIFVCVKTAKFLTKTLDFILKYCFAQIHAAAQRKLSSDTDLPLYNNLLSRYASIMGSIAVSGRNDIYRFCSAYFDPQRKISSDELILVLSCIRYIPEKPQTEEDSLMFSSALTDLVSLIEKSRKASIKNAALHTLCRFIQPLTFPLVAGSYLWEQSLWGIVVEIHKKARKWLAVDEIKPYALRLCAIILVNAPRSFFADNVDFFIMQDLSPCAKGKSKLFMYETALQFLRGRFFADSACHLQQRVRGEFDMSESYSSTIRARGELSDKQTMQLLTSIWENIFQTKKQQFSYESVDVVAELVVQIAAHYIEFGLNCIRKLLTFDSGAAPMPDACLIGMKALRTICDANSGFIARAFSRSQPNFLKQIQDAPFQLEANLAQILVYINVQIGIDVIGTGCRVVDFEKMVSSKKTVTENTRLFSADYRTIRDANMIMFEESPSAPIEETKIWSRSTSMSNLGSRILSKENIASLHSLNSSPSFEDIDTDGSYHDISYHDKIKQNVISASLTSLEGNFEDESNRLVSKAIDDLHNTFNIDKPSSKYVVSSVLSDNALKKKKASFRFKPEQSIAFKMLKEFSLLLPFVPAPEFIGGNHFLGAYIVHMCDEIVFEVGNSIFKVFYLFPELRVAIINGFINFMKISPFQDDISVANIAQFVVQLTKVWANDSQTIKTLDPEAFPRVSCKMDAIVMLLLARPNAIIRKSALRILFDLQSVDRSRPEYNLSYPDRNLSLADILTSLELTVCKNAIRAFLDKNLKGHLLIPSIWSKLKLVSFQQLAGSDYFDVFKYYLGALANQFALRGRPKATRRCSKFLRQHAVPLMALVCAEAPTNAFHFSASMILVMAFSGCPLVSEVEYKLEPSKVSNSLLFDCYKNILPRILAAHGFGNVKPILESLNFLHSNVVQLFCNELLAILAEVRHNPELPSQKRVLESLMYSMRRLAQSASFKDSLTEPSISPNTLLSIVCEMIGFGRDSLTSTAFLTNGPVSRMKMAINFCLINQQLAHCLTSIKGENEDYPTWDANEVVAGLSSLNEWYKILAKVGSNENKSQSNIPLIHLQQKMKKQIGLTAEKLMEMGGVFENQAIPENVLAWLTTLQDTGYRVFTRNLLVFNSDALAEALSKCYYASLIQNNYFHEAIFELFLARYDEGHHLYINTKSRRDTFSKDYFANRENMTFDEAGRKKSQASIQLRVVKQDTLSLRKYLGALLFFSIYSLMNADRAIRNRSLLFLISVLKRFNPDNDGVDIDKIFDTINPYFYSNSCDDIKKSLLTVTKRCAGMFPSETLTFLWEAVRCSRTPKETASTMLSPPQKLVFEIILPWCTDIDLRSASEDVGTIEFFRFILDSAFYEGWHRPEVRNLWDKLVSSRKYGEANAKILTIALIAASDFIGNIRSEQLDLLIVIFTHQPSAVADAIIQKIVSSMFPTRLERDADLISVRQVLKEYVGGMGKDVQGSVLQFRNEFSGLFRSSFFYCAELIRKDYNTFREYLGILLNFVIAKLPVRIQENSPSAEILISLLEGYATWIRLESLALKPEYKAPQGYIRKIIDWFETPGVEIDWEFGIKADTCYLSSSEQVPSLVLLNMLFSIFTYPTSDIRVEVGEQAVLWFKEGSLSNETTLRALEMHFFLVNSTSAVPSTLIENLNVCIVDQLVFLTQFSSPEVSSPIPKPALSTNINYLNNSRRIIASILKLETSLMNRFVKASKLQEYPELFWTVIGLLRLPVDFSEIIVLSVEHLVKFIENVDMTTEEFSEQAKRLSKSFKGLLSHLLHGLFAKDPGLQRKAYKLLLTAWIHLPSDLVDPNPTGFMYTVLYACVWIFSRLSEPNHSTDEVTQFYTYNDSFYINYMASKIQQDIELFISVLNSRSTKDYTVANHILDSISTILRSERPVLREFSESQFEMLMYEVLGDYVPTYVNNIAEFIGQAMQLGNLQSNIVLHIVLVLWKMCSSGEYTNIGSLTSLLTLLPCLNAPYKEIPMIYTAIFKEETNDGVKDIDLVHTGQPLALAKLDLIEGDIKAVKKWFTSDLGYKATHSITSTGVQRTGSSSPDLADKLSSP